MSLSDKTKEYRTAFLGFGGFEEPLINASVRLSAKRNNQPTLVRIDIDNIHDADIVFIDDTFQTQKIANFENEVLTSNKVIIRVDSDISRFAHHHVKRPLQWSNLPYIVAIALEKHSEYQRSRTLDNMPVVQQQQLVEQPKQALATILVVDDSDMIRNHLSEIIRQKGLSCHTAASVSEAMSIFQQHPFDCVLMDVVMPDIDGYDGCKLIKKLSNVPVIMLTSKSSPFDKIKGKFAGCDAYLTKPTTVDKLFHTIASLID